MPVTKSDIKILNYVHHRHFRPVTYMSLSGKFSKHEVNNLIKGELLSYVPVIVDYQGIPSEKLAAESAISLTKDGIYVVEQNQWFDTQYLLTQIIRPYTGWCCKCRHHNSLITITVAMPMAAPISPITAGLI